MAKADIARQRRTYNFIDLTGKIFGRLTVLSENGKAGPETCWLCQCSCGKQVVVRGVCLRNGMTQSCGCFKTDILKGRKLYHLPARKIPEYYIWVTMRQRCNNPNNHKYKDYGGRGITVCDRWNNSFAAFYEDMGPRPSPKHQIERIRNDLGYSKENCRWATMTEQGRNKRNNALISIDGISKTRAEVAENLEIGYFTLRWRENNVLSPDKLLSKDDLRIRLVEWNGKSQSIAKWCRELGVKYGAVARRIRVGWTDPQEILFGRPKRKKDAA